MGGAALLALAQVPVMAAFAMLTLLAVTTLASAALMRDRSRRH
ncbi:hypothetical protein RSO41_07045 [Halomonas sp. I1]|nr:hypothetical protein [Halomonas sp. I1]MDT8894411.1 hypothetical protein [Halomonas sp. I1]